MKDQCRVIKDTFYNLSSHIFNIQCTLYTNETSQLRLNHFQVLSSYHGQWVSQNCY